MKKIWSFMLVVILSVSLCGCQGYFGFDVDELFDFRTLFNWEQIFNWNLSDSSYNFEWITESALWKLITGQEKKKTQETYLSEFSEYNIVNHYNIETNDFGEQIISANVQCPDYISVFQRAYETMIFEGNETDEEIESKFFKEVSKQLTENPNLQTIEFEVNLTKENGFNDTINSMNDEEIVELISRKVCEDDFEEFCLDVVMEYSTEITEEGLFGEE